MARRKLQFENGEYYHLYNRGVEKRNIISDKRDQRRFLRSLNIFNTTKPVRSIFEYDVYINSKKYNRFGTRSSK